MSNTISLNNIGMKLIAPDGTFDIIKVIADTDELCAPCGVCRQVLREFCPDTEHFVVLLGTPEEIKSFTLEGLLPESFGPDRCSLEEKDTVFYCRSLVFVMHITKK